MPRTRFLGFALRRSSWVWCGPEPHLLKADFMQLHGAVWREDLTVDSLTRLDSPESRLQAYRELGERRGVYLPSTAAADDVSIDRLLAPAMLESLKAGRALMQQQQQRELGCGRGLKWGHAKVSCARLIVGILSGLCARGCTGQRDGTEAFG